VKAEQSRGGSNQSMHSNGETQMFEVVISRVKSGRVDRTLFATREEAERHLAATEERLLRPRPNSVKAPSLRDYRMEIQYRERPIVAQVQPQTRRRKAVAA
jgi:hypothetical protein